jgi:hypothetical protein
MFFRILTAYEILRKKMNKYNTTIKLLAVTTATLLLVPIVAQVPVPIVMAQSTQDDETALRVAKNKQYREEVTLLYEQVDQHLAKIAEYEEQKESAKSEQEKQDLEKKIQASLAEIARLEKRIEELQQLNWKLYEMDPELKERLLSAKKLLFDKYENPDSSTYVGDNAVEWVAADHLRRHINVFINPDKEAAEFAVPTETSVNGIPVVIDYGKEELISCVNNDNQDECDPLVGGISIADQNRVPDLNTLGYKAFVGTTEGFVMPRHSVDGVDSIIVQPGDDEDREVGSVLDICCSSPWGDMAFVDASEDIVNEIWRGSGTFFTIVDKTDGADGEHQLGTWVRKVGAATGQSLHEIDDWNSDLHYYRAELITGDVDNGDSGSPVFTGTSNVNLYGMTWGMSEGGGKKWIKYQPQDFIEEQIGAVPALE